MELPFTERKISKDEDVVDLVVEIMALFEIPETQHFRATFYKIKLT